MKLTQDVIERLEKALDMRKKDGTPVWEDGDELSVNIAGTFVADKFITITNKTKNPVRGSIARSNNESNEGTSKG